LEGFWQMLQKCLKACIVSGLLHKYWQYSSIWDEGILSDFSTLFLYSLELKLNIIILLLA
jgi:hypothetical protein